MGLGCIKLKLRKTSLRGCLVCQMQNCMICYPLKIFFFGCTFVSLCFCWFSSQMFGVIKNSQMCTFRITHILQIATDANCNDDATDAKCNDDATDA